MSGTLIEKTTYDLGLAVAANFATCGLPAEVQAHYLQNKHLIPEAILRGFTLPIPEVQTAPALIVRATPAMFKTADTDLVLWLKKAEEFAKRFLGVEVKLSEMFNIPEEIPWKSAIPVFDLGLNNRQAVEKVLRGQTLTVWEEEDVMKYSGSEANPKPTLHLIQNSIRPDEDTVGQTPDQLKETGKNWLSQRGYVFAFGLHYLVTGEYLDPQTWTWFPDNRLSSGEVANGDWNPDRRRVRLHWNYADDRDPLVGARLAISVPLKS